ncbi:MAG: hypothetical protein JWL88_120 [Parcubacteria group bacterium]|nr:hypothetical protein [Parcubacteria group bacterium]
MKEGVPNKPVGRQEKQDVYLEKQERLRNPEYLPKRQEITDAFDPDDWGSKEGSWYAFCFDERNPTFEFLNEEFLDAFSSYLHQRMQELGGSANYPITILEVGAGNGRLSHFLQQKLDAISLGTCKVIATDSGEWKLNDSLPVEKLNHIEALEKYEPQIVLFSWMPLGQDTSKDFRAAQSVQEYILIGDTECCGDNWQTWGYDFSSFDEDEHETNPEHKIAPYVQDGFEKDNLNEISDTQICRIDYAGRFTHSRTVSFRRKE